MEVDMAPLTEAQKKELERKLAEEQALRKASIYTPSDIYRPGPPPGTRTETQTRQVPPK
jgi:hypothetical protein